LGGGGCVAADAHFSVIVVASPWPLRVEAPGPSDADHDVLIQSFMRGGRVATLDVDALLRFSGLDAPNGSSLHLSPFQQRPVDAFRAVVDSDGA
jgi:hypothetical protein